MILVRPLVLVLALTAQPPSGQQWTNAGWHALQNGATDDASADFAKALEANPNDPMALLGAATIAHTKGQDSVAESELRSALQVKPDLTIASIALGQLLYGRADLQGAIDVYDQALSRAPDDARLTTTLAAWRHEADVEQSFSSRVATHFTILFEGPPDQPLAAHVLELLESIYWNVGGTLGAYPNDAVTVILYSKEQFRDVTRAPSWAGGQYDGRIRMPVAGTISEKELRRVLTHEFTHAVVHSLAPRGVPQWLNEGLAVLMERGGTAPEIPANTSVPPLATLEGSFDGLTPAQAGAAYVTSAAATQTLLDRAGPNVIYNLLTNLGNGMTFDEAFERAAMMSYKDFQASWRPAS